MKVAIAADHAWLPLCLSIRPVDVGLASHISAGSFAQPGRQLLGTSDSKANGHHRRRRLEIAPRLSKPHITAARTPEEPRTYPAI
jgi:hypothetical protein